MELMITIVIVGILAAMSVGLGKLVKKSRLTAQINTLVASIGIARSEAIKRGGAATICSSADGMACSGSADWATGWIVFDDADADGVLNGDNTLIRVSKILTGGNTLTYQGDITDDSLTFTNQGRFMTTPGNKGTFILEDTTISQTKKLIISPAGRGRVVR